MYTLKYSQFIPHSHIMRRCVEVKTLATYSWIWKTRKMNSNEEIKLCSSSSSVVSEYKNIRCFISAFRKHLRNSSTKSTKQTRAQKKIKVSIQYAHTRRQYKQRITTNQHICIYSYAMYYVYQYIVHLYTGPPSHTYRLVSRSSLRLRDRYMLMVWCAVCILLLLPSELGAT